VSGLRAYERDAGIPALGGDEDLVPPRGDEVARLVEEHLLLDSDQAVSDVAWEFARYKPGASVTTVHSVELDGGTRRVVTIKRYKGDKAETLAGREPDGEELGERTRPLRPSAFLPAEGTLLSVFPADRELRGLHRVLDVRRTARLLEDAGWCPPRSIKKRRARLELLRFKPERRAVFRLDARLRGGAGASSRALGARVLPVDRAERLVARRRDLAEAGLDELAPRLVAADERAGIVFEEWIAGERPAPGPELDRVAGSLLARLHRLAPGSDSAPTPSGSALAGLFDLDSDLARLAAGFVESPPTAGRAWCHGDFHEEQVIRDARRDRLALLDLDELRVGDPLDDLASWIADALARQADSRIELSGHGIVEGYLAGGGEPVRERELAAAVARALAHRAAGCLRRMERDAVSRARHSLELAREIAPERTVFA
jgi:hypothetical protein